MSQNFIYLYMFYMQHKGSDNNNVIMGKMMMPNYRKSLEN